jgi:hypothetical protein
MNNHANFILYYSTVINVLKMVEKQTDQIHTFKNIEIANFYI